MSDSTLSNDELMKRIKGAKQNIEVKGDEEKRGKGVKEQISLDPRIYDLYNYFKSEEGYTGSFNQFLIDFMLDSAKEKGYDIQVVKSARSGRFVRGSSSNDNSEEDEYDRAMQMLGYGSSNPKEQTLRMLMEQKQQEIEQKRLQNMQLQMNIENQRLELERKKIENEKLRREVVSPPQDQQQVNMQAEIYKMIMDNQQKMFEVLAKAKDSGMGNDFMKFLLEQNQNTNNTIVALLNQQNEKKLAELENAIYATSSDQQLEKMKKQWELFKSLGLTGGGMTTEQMQKEYELRLKQLEMEHEAKKEERDERRAEHLTDAIRDAFSQFTQSVGEPIGKIIAEQTKERINKMAVTKQEQAVSQTPPPPPPPPEPVQQIPPQPEPQPQVEQEVHQTADEPTSAT